MKHSQFKPASKPFLGKDFLLESDTARYLYHEHAARYPIIDYHCHLSPADLADDRRFDNLTKIWLDGDHYKWRAMRANGVAEEYCTGDADDYDKFRKWAGTVPYAVRNPLYHWTHMELNRHFGIDQVLNPESARTIYDTCSGMLRTAEFSARNILRKMNVEVVCTSDDPTDSLEPHARMAADGFDIRVLPTFRPDKVLGIEKPDSFISYLQELGRAADVCISSLKELYEALEKRHEYFHSKGCRLSDTGVELTYAETYTDSEITTIFTKGINNKPLTDAEIKKYKSAMLVFLARLNHDKGWVQQFHLGALRSNNTRLLRTLGPDTGFDSIGDLGIARPLSAFLDRLDSTDQLAKTILYNINPADNEVVATMAGNFNDGTIPGKVQHGAAWWFLDQKDGIESQLNALSNMGLVSRFVGMLTDSRSFLSYPRHEYFRRILCNLFGSEIERGELPDSELPWISQVIGDICYTNAQKYFGF